MAHRTTKEPGGYKLPTGPFLRFLRVYFLNLTTTATTFSKKWSARFPVFKFGLSGAGGGTRTRTPYGNGT